uniref:Nucleoside diphosphate kinase B n=1 Tax=Takifugu rubripes TaxID=31033 RepID=A0A3B5KHL7_TAKRU
MAKVLQLTLAVIKPDAVAHPLMLEALHQRILDNSFVIVRCKDLVWRRQDSERFYAEHSGRFFYQRLVEFMSSGPMRAYVLAREDAIRHWRDLMGPTKVFRARHTSPASIRAQFGLTDTRNTTHGSGRSPLCVLISTKIIITVRSQLISAVKEKPREGEDRRSKIIVACFFSFNRGTLNKI